MFSLDPLPPDRSTNLDDLLSERQNYASKVSIILRTLKI
jgi:hypothetical protein